MEKDLDVEHRNLDEVVGRICSRFVVSKTKIGQLTEYFIECMERGLQSKNPLGLGISKDRGLPMIPTFVTDKPRGNENGVTLLAADLGGTNFRVCSVELLGNHRSNIQQEKTSIPAYFFHEDKAVTGKELFKLLALITYQFLNKYHKDQLYGKWKMGFTFSYPVDQVSLKSGILIRWTKGFQLADMVGKDVAAMFQQELNDIGLPDVHVVALTNDTTGTLLSTSYAHNDPAQSRDDCVLGCIFGTGTNGCYMEKIENIHKLGQRKEELIAAGKTHMCVNTEWGSFDNDLTCLPTTEYDILLDKRFSTNPGYHMFEKRISGLYLGEILRNILIDLAKKNLINLKDSTIEKAPFSITTELLSHIEVDSLENGLENTRNALLKGICWETTLQERIQVQRLVRAISRRAAYLAIVPIAAILIKTNALNRGYHSQAIIGCDGSVVEHYPGFRSMMRHALALSPIGSEDERDVHLVIAKDGSGVGAALCALNSEY